MHYCSLTDFDYYCFVNNTSLETNILIRRFPRVIDSD